MGYEDDMITCPTCYGRDGYFEITCTNCSGTGYDPQDDKPFAQCHTCYGEKVEEVDICPECSGVGKVEENHSPEFVE